MIKDVNISPCRGCDHEFEDKQSCLKDCDKLKLFQLSDDNDFSAVNESNAQLSPAAKHQKPEQEKKPICSVCEDKEAKIKGMCQICYLKSWRGENSKAVTEYNKARPKNRDIVKPKKKSICSVCGRKEASVKGMCKVCYTKSWREGNNKKVAAYNKARQKIGGIMEKENNNTPEEIISIDLSSYPKLFEALKKETGDGLLPIGHVIIGLLAESLAG